MHRVISLVLIAACAALLLAAGGCRNKTSPGPQVAQNPGSTQPPKLPKSLPLTPTPVTPPAGKAWTGDVQDFTYKTFDGVPHHLSEFAGQPLVVNFWAAWCPPCKAELPDFQKVYNQNKGKFVFLSVAVDENQDPKKYVKDHGFDWNFGLDIDGSNVYQVSAIPLTLFIDAKGNIKQRFEGGRSGEDFAAALKTILINPQSV